MSPAQVKRWNAPILPKGSQNNHKTTHLTARICEPLCEAFWAGLTYTKLNTKEYAMLRSTLLITAGLVLLPVSAFAQGTDCPLHKKLEAQRTVQTAELSPVTAPAVQSPRISTPRASVVTPTPTLQVTPSLIEATERGVDVPAKTVQVAENKAQTSYGSGNAAPKKEKAMIESPHAAWTSILQKYVSAPDAVGLTHFNYGGLKASAADTGKLQGYIKSLGATNPDALSRDEAIAYYANLYNALTIDLIVQNYPLNSIRKAKTYNGSKVGGLLGPWKKVKTSINGQTVSLDDVEHQILRVKYPSPYVHYMVNCASVGCPNLLDRAWEADSYEALRKEAAAAYINSPRGVVITPKGLKVSSIFKWFKDDFGGKDGVLKHIRQYADTDLAAAIDGGAKVVDYDYDWSVNN